MSKRDSTGQSEIMLKVGEDLSELHLRREIERMSDERKLLVSMYGGQYTIWPQDHPFTHGPYTLQQCHDKLREISGEDT